MKIKIYKIVFFSILILNLLFFIFKFHCNNSLLKTMKNEFSNQQINNNKTSNNKSIALKISYENFFLELIIIGITNCLYSLFTFVLIFLFLCHSCSDFKELNFIF